MANAWALAYDFNVPTLDPEDLRAYARRDWSLPERLARAERVKMPLEQKVALNIALYEAARATLPGWPDRATRRADLECHLRVKAWLMRAPHVGAR